MMYEHVLVKHMSRGEWPRAHNDQIFDGSAVPRVEKFVGTRIDVSFVDRSLRRSAALTGVPRRTADAHERLCALAGYHSAASGRADQVR
jgi:hypothetical protein